jgi:hypothetical protein
VPLQPLRWSARRFVVDVFRRVVADLDLQTIDAIHVLSGIEHFPQRGERTEDESLELVSLQVRQEAPIIEVIGERSLDLDASTHGIRDRRKPIPPWEPVWQPIKIEQSRDAQVRSWTVE